ncbi:MAG: hypothetical protein IJM74_09820 [Bacteroidales bacterium]|nr:hypothetical protein [Bacteroidales bacterium]
MKTEISHDVWQYSRSKNRHSVLFYYYRIVVLFFVCFSVASVLPTVILSGYDWNTIGVVAPLFMFFFTFCFAWAIKGSLVESVTIDNPRQEIRIVHYRLSGVSCERAIPFEGFRWNVLFARDGNRLRMYPCEGKRVVVVEGRLGWTYEDFAEIVNAMHQFTKKKKNKK